MLRDAQHISDTPDTWPASPHILWNGSTWVTLYRHNQPAAGSPDYLHTRTLGESGVLGPDTDLRVPAEQLAFASRGPLGYATLTGATLRLWDAGWEARTTLEIDSNTNDGNLWASDGDLAFVLRRYNALGAPTGSIELTTDRAVSAASELRVERIGSRIVMTWVHATAVAGSDHAPRPGRGHEHRDVSVTSNGGFGRPGCFRRKPSRSLQERADSTVWNVCWAWKLAERPTRPQPAVNTHLSW